MDTKPLLKGKPAELHVLDFGLFKVHVNGRVIGICGFLIRTDAGEAVLIDTGFPAKYANDVAKASTEDKLGAFGEVLHLTHDNLPAAQLAKSGTTQIDLLIMTHTHIDHVGGIADFPGVPIVIAQAERALDRPSYWAGQHPIDWPEAEYIELTQDTEIAPNLRLLLTPGHAPGQLAIELELPQTGPVLLTSDAISRPSEIDEKFAGSWDEAQAIHHADRIMARADQRGAFTIFGHCPRQWTHLRKTPAFYG